MHIPLLSTMLGLGAPQEQPASVGEKGDAFAQLLGLVPAQSGEAAPKTALPVANTPDVGLTETTAAPAPVPVAQQAALHLELATALAVAPPQPQPAPATASASGKSLPHTGKLVAGSGKELPVALPPLEIVTAREELPEAVALAKPADEAEQDNTASDTLREPMAFADLILLRGSAEVEIRQPAPRSVPVVARQLAEPAAALIPPQQEAPRPDKQRSILATPPANSIPRIEAAATPAAPAPEIAIPLARNQQGREPFTPRAAEPQVAVAQPAPQLVQPSAASHPGASTPAAEQAASPPIELAKLIDRLVMTRIHSREGRSEVNVPHPDFGRVTLALNMAERDTLGLSMPDAPLELRVAVGQAFAPPPRSEAAIASASDPNPAAFADTRGGDQRREANTSPNPQQARADQARAGTNTGRNGHSDNPPATRRSANGRGILA